MNWFLKVWMMALISAIMTIRAEAKEQKQQEIINYDKTAQIKLMDQNQNNSTPQNRERNQVIHGVHFVDKNGDGYHDAAPDHDKDGIPNGQDQDFQGAGKGKKKVSFKDTDGDGIADNNRSSQSRSKSRIHRGGYNSGVGTGYRHRGSPNGTGYGAGPNCDGTGPKGNKRNAEGLK